MKILQWLKTKHPEIYNEYLQEKLQIKRLKAREFYRKMASVYKSAKEKDQE